MIRSSCKNARILANIQVHDSSIKALLESPVFNSTYEKLSTAHGVAMPLQFQTLESEVNLISLLSILNFGHGYRLPLKRATGRGAYDTIRALIFGLYLASTDEDNLMSAKGLKSLSKAKVAELAQLANHIHVEKAHPTIPGLTIGELGGPLYELVELITNVLNETGTILVQDRYDSLGTFVIEALHKADQNGIADAEVVLDELIRRFPAFQDIGTYQDQPVYVFKKALFLLHALVLRFGQGSDRRIPLPDTDQLPIFSDNVIPSMLVHFGVLDLTQATEPRLASAFGSLTVEENLAYDPTKDTEKRSGTTRGPELSNSEAYVLRAAAVDACEMIVNRAREDGLTFSVTLPALDGWLWSVAKEGRLRSDLSRFTQARCLLY